MNQATFTFRVDDELKRNFASVAKSLDRSGAQLLRDYMRDIVRRQREAEDHDAWFREQVQIGLSSANAGKLTPNEVAEAGFAARRAGTRRRLENLL